MKGLKAKKNGKLNNIKDFQPVESIRKKEANSECEATSTRSNQSMKTHHQMRKSSDKHRSRNADTKSAGSKPRGWHPSLNSISETTS